MSITIKEISRKKELREFVKFPDKLYSNNKYYIPALHKGELNTLDKTENPAFEFCEAKYWLAYKNNKIVGRIAGIINHNYNQKVQRIYARFGWFDYTEDKEVAKRLLEVAETWAKQKNAEFMHGPLGFSSFDASGVLIEGFNELPTSFGHYNFPYYQQFIEEYGYKKDVDWIEYNVTVPGKIPENFIRTAEILKRRYTLHSAELKNKKDLARYTTAIFNLINSEYNQLYAFSELTDKQITELKKEFIFLLNPEYVSIILNEANELIAFGITIPSLSKALQKSKGKLFPIGFLRIMHALRKNDTVDSLLIAVKKEYQNKGIHAIIFSTLFLTFKKRGITNLETTRELEDNNKVKQLWSRYEHRQHKKARCYIKKL